MSAFEGISAWLRGGEGISNEIYYRDVCLSLDRERKALSPLNKISTDKPFKTSPVSFLGRGTTAGNLIECGRFLEIFLSQEPLQIGAGLTCAGSGREKQESPKSVARRVNSRARKQIRRLVNANDFRAMYTLTLAPPSVDNDRLYDTVRVEDQKDYKYVRNLFKVFTQRVKRFLGGGFPYVSVLELHDSGKTSELKRGTWHIHLACEAGNDLQTLAVWACWSFGLVDTQDFRYDKKGRKRDGEIQNPGAYISEYIGKEGAQFGKKKLQDCKRYTCSLGVKRPIKQALGSVDISGDFDSIRYKGKKYICRYYSSCEIPGTNKIGLNAHYQESCQ